MQRKRKSMKRRHPRYGLTSKVRGREITLLGTSQRSKAVVRGQIQNISAGGLCLETAQRIRVSSLVRCEIPLPRIPVAIPTLMQVRWAHRNATGHTYRVGLQFLL